MRLFFCHSSRDKSFVRELIGTLPSIVQPWIDENEVRLAQHLRDVLRAAIESSSFVVAILSRDSINSEWVKYELQTAIENEVKILPIVIDPISDQLPEFIRERRYLYLPDHSQNQVKMVSDQLCEEIAIWMIENDPVTLLLKEQSDLLQAAAIEEGRVAASVSLALAEFIPKMIRAVYLKEYARIEDQHMPPLWLIQCANLVVYDLQTSPIARKGDADPVALEFIRRFKSLVDQCFFIGYYAMSFRRPLVSINVDDSQEYDVEKISLVFDELIAEAHSGNTDLSEPDIEIWNLGLRWIAIIYKDSTAIISKALGRKDVVPDSKNMESVLLKAMFSGVTMARAVERIALDK